MLVHGLRGDQLPDPASAEENLTDEELEVYGVDWEALQNERILRSAQQNGQSDTGSASWIRQVGPPSNLSEVPLFPPNTPSITDTSDFDTLMITWIAAQGQSATISTIWVYGLAIARTIYGSIF